MGGNAKMCNDCIKSRLRKKQNNELTKKSHRRLRKRAIEKLGGKCVMCGFDDPRALQIDHVEGNGNKHRRKSHWYSYYKSIVDGTIEISVQLLCANCNFIKRHENKELYK